MIPHLIQRSPRICSGMILPLVQLTPRTCSGMIPPCSVESKDLFRYDSPSYSVESRDLFRLINVNDLFSYNSPSCSVESKDLVQEWFCLVHLSPRTCSGWWMLMTCLEMILSLFSGVQLYGFLINDKEYHSHSVQVQWLVQCKDSSQYWDWYQGQDQNNSLIFYMYRG